MTHPDYHEQDPRQARIATHNAQSLFDKKKQVTLFSWANVVTV